MADFWDFLIIAVVFWFILRVLEMRVYGSRSWRHMERLGKRADRRHAGREFDEKYGMMVGGIVCLFMGLAILGAQYLFVNYFTGIPALVMGFIGLGGLVLAALGLALLVASIALGMLMVGSSRR